MGRSSAYILKGFLMILSIEAASVAMSSTEKPCSQAMESSKTSLNEANALIINREFKKAISIMDLAIYKMKPFNSAGHIVDDTGTKLTIANLEEDKGHFDVAANLKKSVLEARIKLASSEYNLNCKKE